MRKKDQMSDAPQQYTKKRKAISAIGWVVAWPLIVGFIGAVLIIIGANFIAGASVNTPQGYHLRLLWALFVVVLCALCYGFMLIKKRQDTSLARISIAVLRVYVSIGIIVSIGIMAVIPDTEASAVDAGINVEQTNSFFKPTLSSDPAIAAVLAKIGATDTAGIETKFVADYSDPNFPDKAGEYQAFVDTAGNWSYGVLSAKQDVTGDALDSVVAHEYLHHVWFKSIDAATKIKLTSDLIILYGKDGTMQERVASYGASQALQPTELFSFYCTEVSDDLLTPYVLAECGKYINRSSLVFSR